jgi:pimeloyl-ACP methyl ester carboxylesterase
MAAATASPATSAATASSATSATPDLAPRPLHVTEAGTVGPHVLCLHGIGSRAASFAPLIARLAPVARLLAWDAPGYGESADPEQAPGLDGYADVAAGLLRSRLVPGERAHVLGTSWGGVIAVRLARRHPDLVASLILADSSRGSGHDPAAARAMRARAEALAARGPRAFAEERAPRLLGPDAGPALVQQATDLMATAIRLPGYGYAAESMAATDLTPELTAVDVPALVLCGEHDRVTGVPESQLLAGAMPKGVFVILNGAGHLAHQERPDAFADWVRAHLRIAARLPL